MDHSKFEDLEKKLRGEIIVNKLSDGFDIFAQFKIIKLNSPPLSIAPCVELHILVREMMDYETPYQRCWGQIENFGKMKYTTYSGQ